LVALGSYAGKLVSKDNEIGAEHVGLAGQVPLRLLYLLDNEFNFICTSRVGIWSDIVRITFVILAKVPSSVSVRLQRNLKLK
jgi:hypothetical protein